jgi:hypothetical protein
VADLKWGNLRFWKNAPSSRMQETTDQGTKGVITMMNETYPIVNDETAFLLELEDLLYTKKKPDADLLREALEMITNRLIEFGYEM